MPETIQVPVELWEEIRKVLDARSTAADEDDEDNDYEVLDVLRKMEEIK